MVRILSAGGDELLLPTKQSVPEWSESQLHSTRQALRAIVSQIPPPLGPASRADPSAAATHPPSAAPAAGQGPVGAHGNGKGGAAGAAQRRAPPAAADGSGVPCRLQRGGSGADLVSQLVTRYSDAVSVLQQEAPSPIPSAGSGEAASPTPRLLSLPCPHSGPCGSQDLENLLAALCSGSGVSLGHLLRDLETSSATCSGAIGQADCKADAAQSLIQSRCLTKQSTRCLTKQSKVCGVWCMDRAGEAGGGGTVDDEAEVAARLWDVLQLELEQQRGRCSQLMHSLAEPLTRNGTAQYHNPLAPAACTAPRRRRLLSAAGVAVPPRPQSAAPVPGRHQSPDGTAPPAAPSGLGPAAAAAAAAVLDEVSLPPCSLSDAASGHEQAPVADPLLSRSEGLCLMRGGSRCVGDESRIDRGVGGGICLLTGSKVAFRVATLQHDAAIHDAATQGCPTRG